ncbi:alpha/beta hydrolase, partial [Deltaproteobacteria bacterium PRO3]|nr:alpha/beta hydrolase [Deltaproteobacteria bacterium PRO3]
MPGPARLLLAALAAASALSARAAVAQPASPPPVAPRAPAAPAAPRSLDALPARFALLDGRRVLYRTAGTGPRTLVLVHGWSCSMELFREQLPLASELRLLLVDLPGHGGSDRLPDNEVATVDKSLQELQRIELPPFFHVTADLSNHPVYPSDDQLGMADALMSSHIRYRGFQGDIRQFTAPISFDA